MRRGLLLFAMILGVASAGTAAAQLTDPRPIPQASPVVLGTVVGSNVHSVTVETPDGEHLLLETDSRTVMPYRLQDGTRVRAEFHLMDSGLRHAGRITPLTVGSTDWALLDQEISSTLRADYERELEEDRALAMERENATDEALASNEATHQHEDVTTTTDNENVTGGDVPPNENADNDTDQNELPRTGSMQPTLLVGGLLALATGLGIRFARRRRSA